MKPCLDCKDRTVGCHGNCERYREYREWLDDLNERIIREKNKDNYASAYSKAKTRRLTGKRNHR